MEAFASIRGSVKLRFEERNYTIRKKTRTADNLQNFICNLKCDLCKKGTATAQLHVEDNEVEWIEGSFQLIHAHKAECIPALHESAAMNHMLETLAKEKVQFAVDQEGILTPKQIYNQTETQL